MGDQGETADWMGRTLELAARADFQTSPNPMVGALVVSDGSVVGSGYHARAGLAHAEVVALERAGGAARGADLWVSLEPCCTSGRTGPCTERIIQAGIRRVHVATQDPNPLVSGRGIAALREAGFSSAYVLEYEADPDNPVPAVREAVDAVAAALDPA